MVGLPGRGKSFVARSILRHLEWIGLKTRIFSTKDRRRKEVAVYEPAEYFEEGAASKCRAAWRLVYVLRAMLKNERKS